jgi:hypothetical protein
MAPCGVLRHMALGRTDVSEERISSIFSVLPLLVTANALLNSPILGVASQKTAFYIVTAVKTSNLTSSIFSAALFPPHLPRYELANPRLNCWNIATSICLLFRDFVRVNYPVTLFLPFLTWAGEECYGVEVVVLNGGGVQDSALSERQFEVD